MSGGLPVDLALAGVAVGSAAALSGVGLVVTYRATGVFNLAQGAQAMVTAYLLRELVVVWHWPVAPAALLCLLVVAPATGVLLDRAVFRPLQRRGAGAAETLVASLGVFVLLIGVAVLLWGTTPFGDAPALLPGTALAHLAGHTLRLDTVLQLATVLALAAAVGWVSARTRFGIRLRAVVDDRRLAELSGVDADAVSAAGWAFGSFTAGLVGVLLAPLLLLDPYGLPLLVMETMVVAVAARLRSLPVAVATGLALGIAQAELTQYRPIGQLLPFAEALQANLFAVALLVAALLPWRTPADPGAAAVLPGPRPTVAGTVLLQLGCAVLLLIPLKFRAEDLRHALDVPALALVLLSVVVVTGYGGQISLGQAGYAGLGALGTALLTSGRIPGFGTLPALPALLLATVATALFGLLTGLPAIRRRGLALAFATFAIGAALSRLVFDQPYATTGLSVSRSGLPSEDRAFYAVELAFLVVGLTVTQLLRRGRLGRALTAMRDHQAGAAAAGVNVPGLKLLVFMAGAGIAALGGALFTIGGQGFEPATFDPVRGLLWFTAVVVVGADSAAGAILAAALLIGLDAGAVTGVSALVVGTLAAALGHLPGGVTGLLHRLTGVPAGPAYQLTPLGRSLRERERERMPTAERRDRVG